MKIQKREWDYLSCDITHPVKIIKNLSLVYMFYDNPTISVVNMFDKYLIIAWGFRTRANIKFPFLAQNSNLMLIPFFNQLH